jgi:hypothetical protein
MDGKLCAARCIGDVVKFIVFAMAFMLTGCQHKLTLEEAQALCEKQGGLLVVIYTQKITMSGPGEQAESPGDCVATDKFGVAAPSESPPAISNDRKPAGDSQAAKVPP